MVLVRDIAFIMSLNSNMMPYDSCFITYLCVESDSCTVEKLWSDTLLCWKLACYILLAWFYLSGFFKRIVTITHMTLSDHE